MSTSRFKIGDEVELDPTKFSPQTQQEYGVMEVIGVNRNHIDINVPSKKRPMFGISKETFVLSRPLDIKDYM